MPRVTAPEIGPFLCSLLPGDWNGFACPLFTREVGEEIMRELTSDEDVVEACYSSAQDAFVILRNHDSEPEVFSATADGLNAIGAYCWAWTEVPDSGCEECSWLGWALFNRNDPAATPHGEVQRCDNCQTLPLDDDAYLLARQAGLEVDDSGRVTKTPSSGLRRVVITFDIPAGPAAEFCFFLRPLLAPFAFAAWKPVVEVFTPADHAESLDEPNLEIRPAVFDPADSSQAADRATTPIQQDEQDHPQELPNLEGEELP